MGWFNRLRIRQLKLAQSLVRERIRIANDAIALCADDKERALPWIAHHAKMTRRYAEVSVKIADCNARERTG